MSIEFEDYRVQVKEALEKAGIKFLHEASGMIQRQTQNNSRVRTGITKGSYQYHVDEGNLSSTIGSDLENAIWEEFGTGEYALHGDGRKGGWYYVDEKGEGHFTYGKTPNRPMYNAFNSQKSKVIRRFGEILTEEIGK